MLVLEKKSQTRYNGLVPKLSSNAPKKVLVRNKLGVWHHCTQWNRLNADVVPLSRYVPNV